MIGVAGEIPGRSAVLERTVRYDEFARRVSSQTASLPFYATEFPNGWNEGADLASAVEAMQRSTLSGAVCTSRWSSGVISLNSSPNIL